MALLLHALDKLLSIHVADLIQEIPTDSVGAFMAEILRILMFGHVHIVDLALTQTHNDAILVMIIVIHAIVWSHVAGQFISSFSIKISHLIIQKVLAIGQQIVIIIDPVMELVKAVSVLFRIELAFSLGTCKPVQESESASRIRLIKGRAAEILEVI